MKPIPFAPEYLVDTKGNVFSTRTNKFLSHRTNERGYKRTQLRIDNKKINFFIHRLVWETYVGPIPEGKWIDHIDRVRDNNDLSNLRVLTQQQNRWNSGAKGCTYRKNRNKWEATIWVNEKRIQLGYFPTEAEARNAYLEAKKVYHIIDE